MKPGISDPALLTRMIRLAAVSMFAFFASFTAASADDERRADGRRFSDAELEFFEKQVRPLLAKWCYECHSAQADEIGGGLRLDSRALAYKGGETGTAIVPGRPEQSLLIEVIHYGGTYEMPPDSKLPAEEIATLTRWVKLGAPWPEDVATDQQDIAEAEFPLEQRKQSHWCWAPIGRPPLPKVDNSRWPETPIDHFILAQLRQRGLSPAPPADRFTLIRRVTFDLTGLPPTARAVQEFVNDRSPGAYERLVDRLLNSDRFGERWARHWMDLVRYAETKAFESDYSMPYVYRYRDYLIRAFNADVPYDQFVREAIAGDLIENPRLNPVDAANESVQGPGYFFLTDGHHGPTDVHADEVRVIDNMIDVTSKTFLGLTLSCARCHDHKFDALTTKDYYSLYGVIASSRLDFANTVAPHKITTAGRQLLRQKARVKKELTAAWKGELQDLAADVARDTAGVARPSRPRWHDLLSDETVREQNHPLHPLAAILAAQDPQQLKSAWSRLAGDAETTTDGSGAGPRPADRRSSLADLTETSFGGWRASGAGFGEAPVAPGEFVIAPSGERAVTAFVGSSAASGHLSSRFGGSLKSPTFKLADSVAVRVKGRHARVRLYVQHYELVGRGPTTGKLDVPVDNDDWHWVTFDTSLWKGLRAYLEILHNGDQMQFLIGQQHSSDHHDDAYVAVDRAVMGGKGPPRWDEPYAAAWNIRGTVPINRVAAIAFVIDRINQLLDKWQAADLDRREGDVLEELVAKGLLDTSTTRSKQLAEAVLGYRTIALELPEPVYVRSLSDGEGADEPVYVRGNHLAMSQDPNPRHFLDALDGSSLAGRGSGRRAWAEALVDASNPLTTRVMVNRLWHHVFGSGLVPTVDNFGKMGTPPSHPQLLDYLARDFVEHGWSIKQLLRMLVLSNTYRMSSTPSSRALVVDPDNVYLQRMRIRRLDAESVRDAILATSGRLNTQMYGPSVPVNLDQTQPSRAIPQQSGPLDGDGRRSIYLELRRNYLPGFLRAFDLPNASAPVGRRNVTNVPEQALALMNDPFVRQQAEVWARKVLARRDQAVEQKIDWIHRVALGRPSRPEEITQARTMLIDVAGKYDLDDADGLQDLRVWTDFCHMMLNRKEFIYLF